MHLIRPYTGEYLVNPVPLHMGGNFCSHGCFYCYANLNQPNRRASYADALLFMKSDAGIRGYLKKKNYPIVCSNDSDPFAKSNVEQFLQVKSLFAEKGKKIVYQTRGGALAIDTLQKESPTMVYISFTSDNPEILKANEPGAPTYESRLALAEACVNAGHFVIAGINPFVSKWWNDIHACVERLARIGVKHAWVGQLHFGNQQIIAMPESRKVKNIADIEYGKKLKKPDEKEFLNMLDACKANGINVLEDSTSQDGRFWDAYFNLGFDWFPTMDGLLDELKGIADGKAVAFTFDWFCKWADVWEGLKSSQFKEYLVSFGRTIRNTDGAYKANTMNEAHRFMWQILKYPSRFRHEHISLLTDGDDVVADGDLDVLVYHPEVNEAFGVDYRNVSLFLKS